MAQEKNKQKPEKTKFKGLYLPAALLAENRISFAEKILLADIHSLGSNYNFTYPALGKKFNISRSTAIRAIERLGGKLGLVRSEGKTQNRGLILTEKAEQFFSKTPTPKESKPFVKPESVLEVAEYAASIDYEIDAQRFIDWYEERDWKRKGGKPLTSWQAAVRNWKKRDNNNGRKTEQHTEQVAEFVR